MKNMIEYNVIRIGKNTVKMIPKNSRKLMTISDKLDSLINRIKTDIQQIPENDFWGRFCEKLDIEKSKFNIDSVILSVERDETLSGEALLLLSVIKKQENNASTVMLSNGKPEKLLRFINDENFKNKLMERIKQLQ